MKRLLRDFALALLCFFARMLLRLRYKIEITGKDELKKLTKEKGVLFLPNHPAQTDPVILMTLLWGRYKLSPLVLDTYYRAPALYPLMKMIGALPVPQTTESVSKWKKKRIEAFFEEICKGLETGKKYLIYPSGKLKLSAKEQIGGASLVHTLLQKEKDAQIVLVRTTGLWGSRFSKAYTEFSPNVVDQLLESCKIILKNGIFFVPKRKVCIEFALAPKELSKSGTRMECNQFLENWYNKPYPEGEPLYQVPYSFWKHDVLVPYKREASAFANVQIPDNVRNLVIEQLAKITKKPKEEILPETSLSQDLGLDSLDVMEIYLFLDKTFDIKSLQTNQLQTVQDVLAAAVGANNGKDKPIEKVSVKLPKEKKRVSIHPPMGANIPEAFLQRMKKSPGAIACMDATSGILSYRKLFVAASLLSKKIASMEGKYVGIMLPSSVAAYSVILGTLLAGKIPVMLNWTVGIKNLDHAVHLLDLKNVVTSIQFLERLDNEGFGEVENHLLFLEDVKKEFSLATKLKQLLVSCLPLSTLKRIFKLDTISQKDPAVILFTSGTETLPKAVPLSHSNILSNQTACINSIELFDHDFFYCVLPPFHSFGFSVTGLLPILSGIKALYSPDPTDYRRLVSEIEGYKVTMFCSAPSFLLAAFKAAKPEQLSSVRLFVSGAEKAPKELYDFAKQCNSKVIEGYGITECSPVVTLNPVEEPPTGVGRPIKGVSLCVVSEQTGEKISNDQEGEICIHGPNVFEGYMGSDKNPFLNFDGKKWYRSGDRGHIDEKGFLILSGRMSRFIKVGGEMVSIGALEEDLKKVAAQKGWIQNDRKDIVLALCAREKESEKPELVLFTTFAVDKEAVNATLRDIGHGKIAKINEVRVIKEIPLNGTGKVAYRTLEEMLKTQPNTNQ